MKKALICIVAVVVIGCGVFMLKDQSVNLNKETEIQSTEKISEENLTEEQETISSKNDDSQITVGTFGVLKKCKIDPETGKKMYGTILDGKLSYEMGNMQIGASTIFTLNGLDISEIPVVSMLLLDGNFIPFSMDGSSYKELHEYTMKNNEESFVNIEFLPLGVSETEEKKLWFITIPFYDSADVSEYQNLVNSACADIQSKGGPLKIQDINKSDEYTLNEDLKQFGNYENDIINEVNMYKDCVIQTDDGEVWFIAKHDKGKHTTLLFCDGKRYEGFDGTDSLIWENDKDSYVIKKIDISGLSTGKHTLFSVTLDDNEVYKSTNRGVDINAE